MSNTSIPVLKFLFGQDFNVLSEALNGSPRYEVEDFSSANDLATFLSTVPAGLIIGSLRDRNDLIQIATFMKNVKNVAKNTPVKVVVINFSGDRNFEKAVAKIGIKDFIEPGINTKAFKFKIDFWMKSLNAQVKNNPTINNQKAAKGNDSNKSAEKTNDTLAPEWTGALDLEDDIWILKHENDCKKVLSRWLIRLMGPSPYIGQWVEARAGLWRFDIKESEKDMYVPNDGAWYFSGDQKPDFVWKENIWLIAGENFELFFKNSNQTYSRLKSKGKNLTICKNSIFAQTKESVIVESFDKELVFKKESQKLEDLEGKNTTEQIEGGNLEGKNKGEKRSGHLSGEVEAEGAISQDNLEQKTKTSKESTHWNGKNTHEKEKGKADFGVKTEAHKEGADLERERKDTEHQKYYKNHNEAEKYEAPSEKERGALKKEGPKGPMGGKSSTEQIAKNYDNSRSTKEREEALDKERELSSRKSGAEKSRESQERAKEEAKFKDPARSTPSEKGDSELTGKGETDTLKSHHGQQEQAEKAAREKSSTRKLESDLSGKGETDKLKSHYGNKERDRSGKNETDKQAAHEREAQARKEKESATRKNEVSEQGQRSSKTALDKAWEGQHDYGFKGDSEKPRSGSLLSLEKAREEKNRQKSEEEKELDELTSEAKVISFLTQKGRTVSCDLNDFFDETIIFQTGESGIEAQAQVDLDLTFNFMEKDSKLKMEAQVLTVDDDGEGNSYVTVQISKESVSAFDTFMKLYSARQQNVNEFLKKVKGL